MYSNIFYFKKISKIGGTEQFLYEIAKKYNKYDITVFYDIADINQLERLRKLVRCVKRIKGEKVQCKKAFFNFNLDMIDDVEADEYYFVSHANYEELGYKPPIEHPKLTNYIGVSQFATDKLNEYAKSIKSKIKTQKCYNPLTLEKKEKVLHLVSAGRLDDKVKGGTRMQKLIEALDKYCERTGRHYVWNIFSNPKIKVKINSSNVVLMKPRIDVRPYIADSHYVVQISNDMETYCYTINEALGYGVPIVTTPLSILKELPITDNEHIVLDWNCENVDEVARQIFEKKVNKFEYIPPADSWEDFLIKEKSNYEEEKKMIFLVEATDKYVAKRIYDSELSDKKSKEEGKKIKYYPKKGEQWIVSFERKEVLVNKGFAKEIEAIEEELEEQNEVLSQEEDKVEEIKEEKDKSKKTSTKKNTVTKKKE